MSGCESSGGPFGSSCEAEIAWNEIDGESNRYSQMEVETNAIDTEEVQGIQVEQADNEDPPTERNDPANRNIILLKPVPEVSDEDIHVPSIPVSNANSQVDLLPPGAAPNQLNQFMRRSS